MEEIIKDVKDYFKIKFMELLFQVTNAEMEGNVEKYITGVKHVIRFAWKFLSQTDKQYINRQVSLMNAEIEKAKQDGTNRNKILDIKYQYYDVLFNYVLGAILDSSLMEDENFGVITFEEEEDLKQVSELIRDKKSFKKLIYTQDENDTPSV